MVYHLLESYLDLSAKAIFTFEFFKEMTGTLCSFCGESEIS